MAWLFYNKIIITRENHFNEGFMKTVLASNLILSELSDYAILSMSAYTMSQLSGIAFTKTREST